MRILLSFIGCLCLLLSVSSCKKDQAFEEDITEKTNSHTKSICFDDMTIGQKSLYQLFIIDSYQMDLFNNFNYAKDTLIVEIIDIQDDIYTIKEELTAHSFSKTSLTPLTALPNRTLTYQIIIKNETLRLLENNSRYSSRLFFIQFQSSSIISLNEQHQNNTELIGWKTALCNSDHSEFGYLKQAKIHYKTYEHLNVLVDNTGMSENRPGYMHIYSASNGLVRTAQYSSLTDKGFGWDLLP